jgi:molybdate transport system substrate-binding protein
MTRRCGPVALICLAVLLVGACGDADSNGKPALRVSAAASLKKAFESYGTSFDAAQASFSFAGSDQLAAQIRAGVDPDVFAAANTKLPDQLYREGLVKRPVPFAINTLVIAVPASGARKVRSLDDLARPGVRIAAGSATVPAGSYARKVLTGLPPDQAHAILANIRSNEPDVGGVVGKVSQGAADAGFVYVTDVKAAGGRLRSVAIPANLQPTVVYGAAVVKGAKHPDQAAEFVDGLTTGSGRRALRGAGFGPAPR